MANPTTYHWRNDAVNVYITAADDSARADFPPNNNIIIVCQGSHATTIAHEVGHILNLYHTQETCCGGDGCSDTLMDNASWSADDIARNNFGVAYNLLNSNQRAQVDMVWWNVMSYHNVDDRFTLSSCQMDRESTEAYTDRNRLLSKSPVYLDPAYGGSHSGSFTQPYQTIQQAINAGALYGRVMVLKQGTYTHPVSALNIPMEAVARKGASSIHEAPPAFSLPYSVEESANTAVRQAAVRAQQSDRRADIAGVIENLQQAEKAATGREKSALQLELAQRLRDANRFQEAAAYFRKAADGADQEELRKHATKKAEAMDKAEKQQQEKNPRANGMR
jgi:hypothetical protein